MSKEFLKSFIQSFDHNDIYDLLILCKLTLSHNFYIMIKYLNEYLYDFKSNSKSKILYVNEDSKVSFSIYKDLLGDLSVFVTDLRNNSDYKNGISEKDNFFILLLFCDKFMMGITESRKLQRKLDTHTYFKLIILYNL